MSHPTFDKDTYKLGCTSGDEKKLISRYSTYYDTPPILIKMYKVAEYRSAEKILFERLKKYRLFRNREFFVCDVGIIKKHCEIVTSIINYTDDNAVENIKLLQQDLEIKAKENTDSLDPVENTKPKPALNEQYLQFIEHNIEETDDVDAYIVWSDLKERFNIWFEQNCADKPMPNNKNIKQFFEQNYFNIQEKSLTCKDKRFRGWKRFKLKDI